MSDEQVTTDVASDEVKETTVETETTTPTETAATDAAESQPEEVKSDVTETEVDTITEVKTQTPAPKLSPAYVNFFEQYVGMVEDNKFNDDKKAEQSIKALNNAIKEMFKVGTASAYNTMLTAFKKNKDVLTIEKTLQGIATLSSGNRAVVEVTTTGFRMINNPNSTTSKSINLETVRSVIKNEAFVNWCAKKIG